MRRMRGRGPSPVVKRSLVVNGHKTSVSLERPFWLGFKAIAQSRRIQLKTLASEIDETRGGNLSSAIRLAVLADLQAQADNARADAATIAQAAVEQATRSGMLPASMLPDRAP